MSEAFAVRGRIITPDQIIVDGAVIVEGEEIVWMGEATQAAGSGYGHQIAVAPSPTDGRYIMPGLVDVHCHGGGGQSFPDAPTKEDAMTAVWEHRLHGTTTLVASLATDSPQALRRQAQMLADLADAQEIAGIHFEGPEPGHYSGPEPGAGARTVDRDARTHRVDDSGAGREAGFRFWFSDRGPDRRRGHPVFWAHFLQCRPDA